MNGTAGAAPEGPVAPDYSAVRQYVQDRVAGINKPASPEAIRQWPAFRNYPEARNLLIPAYGPDPIYSNWGFFLQDPLQAPTARMASKRFRYNNALLEHPFLTRAKTVSKYGLGATGTGILGTGISYTLGGLGGGGEYDSTDGGFGADELDSGGAGGGETETAKPDPLEEELEIVVPPRKR